MQVRLDKALVIRGLASTRSRAQFMVKSGVVFINEVPANKTSHLVKEEDVIWVEREANPWVSRAGLKLEFAIQSFKLAPLRGIAMDIGASTGGFSEVLLYYGCEKVFAVDVGKGQLHEKLENDARVENFEGVNAKNLKDLDLPLVDLIVCDASFISFNKVIKASLSFSKENSGLIALIKPQFEVGPNKVGKKGLVKSSKQQKEVCLSVKLFLDREGWYVTHLKECPILGSDGNVEFLIAAKRKTLV